MNVWYSTGVNPVSISATIKNATFIQSCEFQTALEGLEPSTLPIEAACSDPSELQRQKAGTTELESVLAVRQTAVLAIYTTPPETQS